MKVFLWGFLISFLGSLPLGAMNIMATAIAAGRGRFDAFIFAAGAGLVEILYVLIVLILMEQLFRYKRVFRAMGLITGVILLFLAAGSFVAAVQMTGFTSALPVNKAFPFLSGLILSSVNPLHFVFWTGWSTVLKNKHVLRSGPRHYAVYISGISLGTLLGFACYIYGGNYLITRWQSHQNLVNWCIGAVLLMTAAIQFYKTFFVSSPKLHAPA